MGCCMKQIRLLACAAILVFGSFSFQLVGQPRLMGATEEGYADLLEENRALRKDVKDLSKMLIDSHTHVRNLYNNYVKAITV